MSLQAYTVQSILEQLDHAAQNSRMPMMDNLNFPVLAGRMQVYRNEQSWAIIFNMLTLSEPDGVTTIINPIGPQVQMLTWNDYIADMSKHDEEVMKKSDGIEGIFKLMENMLPQMSQKVAQFDELHAQYKQDSAKYVSEEDTLILTAEYEYDSDSDLIHNITVRGFTLSDAEIAHYQREQQSDVDYGNYKMGEALVNAHKDQLLATFEEINRFFPQGLPPLFLTLDAWHHPDLAVDELPSQSETFQLIAKAICSGNPQDYAPTLVPNIHWQQWLE